MSHPADKPLTTRGYIRIVIRGLLSIAIMVALMLFLARRMTYWQAWLFGGVCFVIAIGTAILFADKKELIKERRKPGPGTKWWDKVFYAFFIPAFFSIVIVASLDAGRFGWTPPLPALAYVGAYALFLCGHCLASWCMWVNTFFSSTVRIQTDRGQVVFSDGPYRFVRHPGYVSGMLLAASIAVLLGSLWALVPAGITALLLIVRTALEDATLQKELAGYKDYTKQVKYRLLPGVW